MEPAVGSRPGTAQQPQSAEASGTGAAERHLAEWLPQCARGLDPETLNKVEPHARPAAAAALPRTVADAHRMLRTSFEMNLWALEEMGFLDPKTVWHPANVRVWVDEINGHRSVDWRREAGRTAEQIARRVYPQSWSERTEPLPMTGPADAYTAAEEAALRHAALVVGGPGRAAPQAVAGLSLGAGLRGPQIAAAGPGDIVAMGTGRVAVQVEGPHARVVPVRADCTKLVLRACELASGGRFVTARSRNGVYVAAERVRVLGFGHLELARARSTWLRAHLVAGTPLAALRVIAGPLSLNTLDFLLVEAAADLSAEDAAVEGLRA